MIPKRRSNVTVFAVLTTLTILTWVGFEIYQAFRKTGIVTISKEVLTPLTPSLNKTILDNMEKRRFFSQEEVLRFSPSGPAPTIQETATQEASPSGQE